MRIDLRLTKKHRDNIPLPITYKELWRELWYDLFVNVKSSNELLEWEKRLSVIKCDCDTFYKVWKTINPPSFPLQFEWAYRLKSDVNKKLNKPNLELNEAKALYGIA